MRHEGNNLVFGLVVYKALMGKDRYQALRVQIDLAFTLHQVALRVMHASVQLDAKTRWCLQ